jgi:hypothetical protein
MTSYPLMAMSLFFWGLDPLSADELQVSVAALEEALSGQSILSVTYHTQSVLNVQAANKQPSDLTGTTCVWHSKPGKDFFSLSLSGDQNFPLRKWIFDGARTHVWHYLPQSTQLEAVTISVGAPRSELRLGNPLAFTLGYEAYYRDGGLISYLKAALRDRTVTGLKSKHGFEISLGKHDINGLKDEVIVTVDPAHDHRLVSWRLEQPTPDGKTLETWQFVADEFQAVLDQASGENKWFPLRAHNQTPTMVTRIEVDSVRINHEIPDDQFISPEPPFGTTVRETSATPGALPQVSLIGGEPARQQRLQELANQSKTELDRLDNDGINHDATPRGGAYATYAWMLAVGLLFLAGLRWMSLRKQ